MTIDGELELSSDFFKTIQPLLIVSRFIGLCPISYRKCGAYFVLKLSRKITAINYLCALIVAIMAVWGIINDLLTDPARSMRMKNLKSRYVTICDFSIIIIIFGTGIILAPFKIRRLLLIYDKLHRIDALMPLKTVVNVNRRSSIISISTILVFFTCLLAFDVSLRLKWAKSLRQTFMRNYMPFYSLYYVVIMQEIVFYHLVYFVRQRIQSLNARLAAGVDVEGLKAVVLVDKLWLSTIDSEIFSGKPPGRVRRRPYFTQDRIVGIMKTYELIYETVENVNKHTGIPILMIMLSCLLHLIVTPYFLLLEIDKDGNKSFMVLQVLWTIGHFIRLLIIVEPCQACLDENQKTMNFIFKLLTYSLSEDVKKELAIFALHLTYRRIQFSSLGLIEINRSLLSTVAGSVTTYLVILFQFGRDSN